MKSDIVKPFDHTQGRKPPLDLTRGIKNKYHGKNMLVCTVGMTGSGKSIAADEFVRAGFGYVRFGQINLDEVKRRRLFPNEKNEKVVRLELRKKYGMGALALLNIPKFDRLLQKGNVLGDNMISWAEYKILKEKYSDKLFILAIYASPRLRYSRLINRRADVVKDPKLRYRSFSPAEAKERDYSEIENADKGGPIAMADYTIINDGTLEKVKTEAKKLIAKIKKISL